MILMWFFVSLPPFSLFRGQGPGQGRPRSKGVERIATSPGLQPGPPLVHVDPTRIWPDLPGQVEVDPGPEQVGPTHWGHYLGFSWDITTAQDPYLTPPFRYVYYGTWTYPRGVIIHGNYHNMDNPYRWILWYVWTFQRVVDIPPLWMFHPAEIFMTLEYPQMLVTDFPVKLRIKSYGHLCLSILYFQ